MIYNIMLNEACSSGCGSFLETYAKSVNMDVAEFCQGKPCSKKILLILEQDVRFFMNSKVKQAQKRGRPSGIFLRVCPIP